jgi:hypothetical protein
MKTLYNYINEGILAGQDATLQKGDEMAVIIKHAETQLDELYSVCDNGGVSFTEFEKGVFWKYTKLEGCDLAIACDRTPKFHNDVKLALTISKRKFEKCWKIYFINEFKATGYRCKDPWFAELIVEFDTAKTFKQLCKKVLKPAFKDLDSFKKAFTIYEKS